MDPFMVSDLLLLGNAPRIPAHYNARYHNLCGGILVHINLMIGRLGGMEGIYSGSFMIEKR